MNVVRCSQGHFYDADKFPFCPHCGVTQHEPKHNDSIIRTEETVALREEELQVWEGNQKPLDSFDSKRKHSMGSILKKKNKSKSVSYQDEKIYSTPIAIKTGTIQQTEQPVSVSVPVPMLSARTTDPSVSASGVAAPAKTRGCTVGWLVYLNGTDKGNTCELKSGNNFMGSGADMDIQIKNDSGVAIRNHAKIVFEPKKQEFFLAPGDTSELVYLGGNVIMIPQKLAPYDEITIGDTKMLFVPLCGEMFTWQGEK